MRIGPRSVKEQGGSGAPRFQAMADALSSVPASKRGEVLRMVSCASVDLDAQEVLKRRPGLIRSIGSHMDDKGFKSPCSR
jgi:hypothetical protein